MAFWRKVNQQVRGEVPLAVATAMVAGVALMFVPVVHRVRAYPTALPTFVADGRAVERVFDTETVPPLPPGGADALAAWDALAAATAARRADEARQHQARFAAAVTALGATGPAGPRAVRAHARRRFVGRLGDRAAPLTLVAARHGLTGPDAPAYATRAAQLAWFDFRWERLAIPTPEYGGLEAMTDTLLRLPDGERRALLAWGLAARCPELLGVAVSPRPGEPERCATYRREFVLAAAALDRRYPRAEALAASELLLALGAKEVARRTADVNARGVALAAAQSALLRAQRGYAALLAARPSRRVERHYMAVVHELTSLDPENSP